MVWWSPMSAWRLGRAGKLDPSPHGHGAAAGSQGRQQPHGLEDHRFSAGVGSGNDQTGPSRLQDQVQGHHVVGQGVQVHGLPHRRQQEGVPGFQQAEAALFRVGREPRQQSVAEGGPAQECEALVGPGLEAPPPDKVLPAQAQVSQQIAQEGLDSLGIVAIGLHERIVEGHGLHGFDEDRGPAAAAVQHEPRHEAPALLPHGQAGTAIPLDDHGLVEGIGADPQHLLEFGLHRLEGVLAVPVEARQGRDAQGVQLSVGIEALRQTFPQGCGIREQGRRHLEPVDAQVRARWRGTGLRPGQRGEAVLQPGQGFQSLPQLPPVLR